MQRMRIVCLDIMGGKWTSIHLLRYQDIIIDQTSGTVLVLTSRQCLGVDLFGVTGCSGSVESHLVCSSGAVATPPRNNPRCIQNMGVYVAVEEYSVAGRTGLAGAVNTAGGMYGGG